MKCPQFLSSKCVSNISYIATPLEMKKEEMSQGLLTFYSHLVRLHNGHLGLQ